MLDKEKSKVSWFLKRSKLWFQKPNILEKTRPQNHQEEEHIFFFQYQIEKEIQNNRETTINESLSIPETINNLQKMKVKGDDAHNHWRRKIMQRNKQSMYGIGIGRWRLDLNVSYCQSGERERERYECSYTNFSDELTINIRFITCCSLLLLVYWTVNFESHKPASLYFPYSYIVD